MTSPFSAAHSVHLHKLKGAIVGYIKISSIHMCPNNRVMQVHAPLESQSIYFISYHSPNQSTLRLQSPGVNLLYAEVMRLHSAAESSLPHLTRIRIRICICICSVRPSAARACVMSRCPTTSRQDCRRGSNLSAPLAAHCGRERIGYRGMKKA